jgi:hypothetical protein
MNIRNAMQSFVVVTSCFLFVPVANCQDLRLNADEGTYLLQVPVGNCGPQPVVVCAAPPTCKHSPIYGGTWTPGKPFPKGIACSTTDLPASEHATCSGTGLCVPPSALDGTVSPLYQVLAVLYAPPGYLGTPSPNGAAPSVAEYSSDSKAGTTTSTAKSFKDSNTVSATLSGGAFGDDTSVGFSVEQSTSKQNKAALEITKDAKTDVKVPGPPTDGIDHAYDEIWLALNPSVDFVSQGSAVSWSLQATSSQWLTQYRIASSA